MDYDMAMEDKFETDSEEDNARLCSNGARSPEVTNIWLWATEKLPAGVGFLIYSQKKKKKMFFNRARVDIQRSFHVNSHVT